MNQLADKISTSMSFEEAIANTQALMIQIEANRLSDEEITSAITNLIKNKGSARGFFVGYLTSDFLLADLPCLGIIRGLKSAPEIVSELLIKNLAMSAAMSITHRRNHQEIMALGSEKVLQRTLNLIKQINLEQIKISLRKLQISLWTGEGDYQKFLNRWGYDREQKQIIQQAIDQVND
ncbi:hypothetical protein Sta7437_0722 [Stanieria cyanosphaera PCC 7437]|uniref:Uncharacterized protein n=1 Tax=Stanieria cyanosphaera (strain ATCC 29371 / PCC 7437) TaxID=111780 RepID=K9XQI4_STAC7|nr:hypothetical protein [Stanieria cyanosphaera]AFZ34316.1 hypothetical protein Sta7437_0722 [Stanieria cyanosphaera PCC 7437]